jgi:hypothetical protein
MKQEEFHTSETFVNFYQVNANTLFECWCLTNFTDRYPIQMCEGNAIKYIITQRETGIKKALA